MNLLIDIGNTSMKWCLQDKDVLQDQGSTQLDSATIGPVADEVWSNLDKPDRILVSNVAGEELIKDLQEWVSSKWGMTLELVLPQAEAFGVINAYTEPLKLGVDRWATLVAVRHSISGAACIVDCGTALTIDVLNQDGEHLGGLIMPGLDLMRGSLFEHTNIKPDDVTEGDVSLLARDTGDAISGGTLYTIVAVIDRVVADVSAELKIDISKILTGGDTDQLVPLLSGEYTCIPDLVLRGIAVIAEEDA